jgi:predicted PurR-regulated permease PerM
MTMAERASLIFLGVVLAAVLPLLALMVWPFLTSFLLASILAIVTNPAKSWLVLRIHQPGLATFLTTLATVSLLGLVLAFAGIAITQELKSAYDALSQRSVEEGGFPALVTHTADRVVDVVARRIPVDRDAIREELRSRMKAATGYVLTGVGAAVGGATSILITALLVTIFLYFLLRYGEEWLGRLADVIPLDPRATVRLFQTVQSSVIANVNGVLIVAAGQGMLLSAGFWFLGVPSPVLWGVIAGMASIIPLVGPPLVWVPMVITFIFMGAYWKALLLGLWGAIVVGSLDNVLRPLVVGVSQKQHPMLVGLAAIGGTVAFGAAGILVGPLVVSLVAAVLKEIRLCLTSNDAVVVTAPGPDRA